MFLAPAVIVIAQRGIHIVIVTRTHCYCHTRAHTKSRTPAGISRAAIALRRVSFGPEPNVAPGDYPGETSAEQQGKKRAL